MWGRITKTPNIFFKHQTMLKCKNNKAKMHTLSDKIYKENFQLHLKRLKLLNLKILVRFKVFLI